MGKDYVKTGRPIGRQSQYTPEMGERICAIVSTHTQGYDVLRQMYPDLPSREAVSNWRRKFPDFGTKYFRAKVHQAELLVENIDEMLPDTITTYIDDKGNKRYDPSSASMMIAKLNNRKWTASRLLPKVYGDAKQIDLLTSQNEALREELQLLREELDIKNQKEY